MTNKLAWTCVAATILLTIYGQIIIKWRVSGIVLPDAFGEKLSALGGMLADPWVITALSGAFVASLFWMAAMTRLPLSLAYPFTSLSFVIVAALGILFMGEPFTTSKAGGICLVVAGLVLLSRA
jgi:multidrug transporter EmrE-like cation transporter